MAIPRRTASGTNVAPESENAPYAAISTDQPARTHFRGNEKAVRAFIVNHFPYLHVNPGDDWGDAGPMPDVVFAHPDGSEEFWNGEEWVKDSDLPTEPEIKAEPPVADIPAGQKAHWDGEAWVLAADDGVPEDTGVVTDQDVPVTPVTV